MIGVESQRLNNKHNNVGIPRYPQQARDSGPNTIQANISSVCTHLIQNEKTTMKIATTISSTAKTGKQQKFRQKGFVFSL